MSIGKRFRELIKAKKEKQASSPASKPAEPSTRTEPTPPPTPDDSDEAGQGPAHQTIRGELNIRDLAASLGNAERAGDASATPEESGKPSASSSLAADILARMRKASTADPSAASCPSDMNDGPEPTMPLPPKLAPERQGPVNRTVVMPREPEATLMMPPETANAAALTGNPPTVIMPGRLAEHAGAGDHPATLATPGPKTTQPESQTPATIGMQQPEAVPSDTRSPATLVMPTSTRIDVAPARSASISSTTVTPADEPLFKENAGIPFVLEHPAQPTGSSCRAEFAAPDSAAPQRDVPAPTGDALRASEQTAPFIAARQAFCAALFEAHFDELVFLCSQVRRYPLDSEAVWTDAADAEARLEKEVTALAAGGETVIAALLRCLSSEDADIVGAAAFALLSAAPEESATAIIERFEGAKENAALLDSVTFSMKRAPYPAIVCRLIPVLKDEHDALGAHAASVAAYHGNLDTTSFVQIVKAHRDPASTALLIDGFGTLGETLRLDAEAWLLESNESSAIRAVYLSRLKAGDAGALHDLRRRLEEDRLDAPWLFECLALGGGKHALECLDVTALDSPSLAASALVAMGWLGNPAAVPALLRQLDAEEDRVRHAAAEALTRITGAAPTAADVPPPAPEAGEDGAVDSEDAAAREAAEDTARDDGVDNAPRYCLSRSAWEAWWQTHGQSFAPDRCYRFGELFSLRRCIDEIAYDKALRETRYHAHLELLVRGGATAPFDLEWPVARQRAAVIALEAWWSANQGRFSPGNWYFAGEWLR